MATDLRELVPTLAAEFPAFTFTTQQTHDGYSLVAERRPGQPGLLYVVITSDPGEMRRTLSTQTTHSRRRKRR